MADVERLAPLRAVDVPVGHGLRAVQPRARGQQGDGFQLGEGEVEVYRHSPRDAGHLALGSPPASWMSRRGDGKMGEYVLEG